MGSRRAKIELSPYYLILPSVILLIVFFLVPIVGAIRLTFTSANILTLGHAPFVGLKNYVDFLAGGSFFMVLRSTVLYVIFGVSLTFILGLMAALLMNREFWGKGLARTLLILPWAVPQVVLVIIWRWMLNPHYGIVNYFLHLFGAVPPDFSWFSSPSFAMAGILSATVWKQYPLSMLILLAGLQTIPLDLYDASSVDGATGFQKFRFITLPGLRYMSSVLLLLLTIWHFGNFVIIWLMTGGGPADQTATLTIFTYLNAFRFGKFGYGAAIGVFILLCCLIFAAAYYRVFLRRLGRE